MSNSFLFAGCHSGLTTWLHLDVQVVSGVVAVSRRVLQFAPHCVSSSAAKCRSSLLYFLQVPHGAARWPMGGKGATEATRLSSRRSSHQTLQEGAMSTLLSPPLELTRTDDRHMFAKVRRPEAPKEPSSAKCTALRLLPIGTSTVPFWCTWDLVPIGHGDLGRRIP